MHRKMYNLCNQMINVRLCMHFTCLLLRAHSPEEKKIAFACDGHLNYVVYSVPIKSGRDSEWYLIAVVIVSHVCETFAFHHVSSQITNEK